VYPYPAPGVVTWGIAVIALALASLFVVAHRVAGLNQVLLIRTAGKRTAWAARLIVLWLSAFAIAAGTGVLARFDARPPPLLLAMVVVIAGSLIYALSPAGGYLASGLPLAALVGFQAFRLPLELVMHEAARAGVMPPQMTFTGWNFDIFTGITAALLAPAIAARWAPRWLIALWNTVGLALVLIVAGIGVASTPAIHAFGLEALNTFIAWFPFVWLPAVMVAAAITGHLLVFRRLAMGGS
jgi:hypothetical protein